MNKKKLFKLNKNTKTESWETFIQKWFKPTNKKKKVAKKGGLRRLLVNLTSMGALAFIIISGFGFIWLSSLKIPSFDNFEERTIAQSTKIYDRTGEVLLFDINQDIKREIIDFEEMGDNIKNATIAIEDDEFYNHNGFRPKAFLRAVKANIQAREFSQGGSTITQQIVKNTLLTNEKRISRKIKEIVLAIRIEKVLTKDEILAIYLNEIPYGGSIYGISEASHGFFNKKPIDLTIAESAYLAGIPQAPTFFSPYGDNTEGLKNRQTLVLTQMKKLGYITVEEFDEALVEEVIFLPKSHFGIKAPHFVFYVREYLEETYGKDIVEKGGLKVITTLDYELQQKAEEIVYRRAIENEELWDAENASLVAMDPNNGEILTMVGSRNYFDENIDGKFNVALAERQPGSSFKPIVYAQAFEKGYTAEATLFDLKTEFQATCDADSIPLPGYTNQDCYAPENYDNLYKGPLSIRQALAQSRNIPSVKLLYLAGLNDSVKKAKEMGIGTLREGNFYGLTLVLGGGEVRLLDMATAYSTFANEGIKYNSVSILKVESHNGETLEESKEQDGERVLSKNSARTVSSILDDDYARIGLFNNINNFMYFGNRNVAGKTGTTNNNKDAWMLGYTPEIVVGVWSGNNDNTPMSKGSVISGALWREFMDFALTKVPATSFIPPNPNTESKPALRGYWTGGEGVTIDIFSNKLATQWTPEESQQDIFETNVHTILYWINKNNPSGPTPLNPESNNQYQRWESSVQNWWQINSANYGSMSAEDFPTEYDDIHTEETQPSIKLTSLIEGEIYYKNQNINISPQISSVYEIVEVEYYLNNVFMGVSRTAPFSFNLLVPEDSNFGLNTIKAVLKDNVLHKVETSINITVDEQL